MSDERNPLEVQEDCWQAQGAYDQPEEEQIERIAAKRQLVKALTDFFTHSRAYRLAVERFSR